MGTPTFHVRNDQYTAIQSELESLREKLESLESEQHRLLNTIHGLARECDTGIGCLCSHCSEAYLLLKNKTMYCPHCENGRTM